jgi:hypothetical protein
VNAYYTATRGTDYRLLFTDATVSHLPFFSCLEQPCVYGGELPNISEILLLVLEYRFESLFRRLDAVYHRVDEKRLQRDLS